MEEGTSELDQTVRRDNCTPLDKLTGRATVYCCLRFLLLAVSKRLQDASEKVRAP